MSASRKNKILITRDLPKATYIGIISQKLPHEIVQLLTNIFGVKFEKKSSSQIEAFVSLNGSERLVLISNYLLKEFQVDYFLIILGEINVNKSIIDNLKKDKAVLGAYILNVPKKKSEQIINNLISLL